MSHFDSFTKNVKFGHFILFKKLVAQNRETEKS